MWHDPVQCKVLKLWIKKCDDDSETSNWLAANTKATITLHFVAGAMGQLPKICVRIGMWMHRNFHFYFVGVFF